MSGILVPVHTLLTSLAGAVNNFPIERAAGQQITELKMPKMAKSVLAVGTAMSLAIGVTTLVNPAVAQAADCPNNVLCLYQNTSWGGNVMLLTKGTPNIGSAFNDRTSSFSNPTDLKWCLFQNADYGGRLLVTIMPRTASATVGSDANDRTTSVTYWPQWCK
jgi:hypothetical protein